MSILSSLTAAVSANRRDALRVAVQTVAATAATFMLMSWSGLPHMSWAVLSALFTIQLSADASLHAALGRLGGSLLGVAVGLAVVSLVGGQGEILVRLVVAAAVANAVATVWPSLRYASVTAAIVALHHDPDLDDSLQIALAVTLGAMMGTVAALLAWPDFGRDRAARTLQRMLLDCRALLELAVEEPDDDGERKQDAVHARFLRNLEAARSQAAGIWFRPRLRSGVRLGDALLAAESLWHGLVILDRVVSGERDHIGPETLDRLRPAIREVQRSACRFVDEAANALQQSGAQRPESEELRNAVQGARDRALKLSFARNPRRRDEERSVGLHALIFALDEVERRLIQIAALAGQVRPQR